MGHQRAQVCGGEFISKTDSLACHHLPFLKAFLLCVILS